MPNERPPLSLANAAATVMELHRRFAGVSSILAFVDGESPADFLVRNVVAAWIAKHFPDARMTVACDVSNPHRSLILVCNPFVGGVIEKQGNQTLFPLDWFDLGTGAPVRCGDTMWTENNFSEADLMLLPGMLDTAPIDLAGFDRAPPLFRIPRMTAEPILHSFVESGFAQDRWIGCVVAEPDDPSTAAYVAAIRNAGGRCITAGPRRLCSDDMLTLPPIDDALAEWTAAIAIARFAIVSDPLAAAFASALGTPVAAWRIEDPWRYVWDKDSRVVQGEGVDASFGELLNRTVDCSGWRRPRADLPVPNPGTITFPLPKRSD